MKPQFDQFSSVKRIHFWYVFIILIFAVFAVRLFYLQVIRHDHYKTAAQSDQYKEYKIAAPRGVIKAHDGERVIPIVLNHQLFTVYADPELVKDVPKTAKTLSEILGGDIEKYTSDVKSDGRYVILAKKIDKAQADALMKKKLPGIGAQAQEYRTYPQGSLAAQLLGFVDESGKGRYGLEQALNSKLIGKPGELKAVTDIDGVPLAASEDNVRTPAKPGSDLTLTLDIGMQKQTEQLLKEGLDAARSQSGSVVVLDAKTSAVKAMASYPTYDPAHYGEVEDPAAFNNLAVSESLEIGSVMKPLTAAAALDKGVISADTTYYDPRQYEIDDSTVRNIEEDGGAGVKSINDILNLSLNTGATWLLMQMGGGELNRQGREIWHGYMTNNFRFGEKTGIEQGYEDKGFVPSPTDGYGLNITYANTSFGQAMTATMLQMAGAFAAALNGGVYNQPHLVESTTTGTGEVQKNKPKVYSDSVVKPRVSKQLQPMLEYVVDKHRFARKFSDAYSVGGKTGTAQIANPAGGYFEDEYNGTYVGFVGGDDVEYIIAVVVNKPKIPGYAGSQAAQPLFGTVAHMLIDNFNVTTKTNR
jgi:cell division protein FtsI/penicillin-binding protein 2